MALAADGNQALYDNALMGILQNCGKLPPFLDAVFSFLARRTDFYVLMKHERAKMGFPPGVAESMVLQAFKKYEVLTRKKEAEIMRQEETKKVERMASPPSSGGVREGGEDGELAVSVATQETPPADEKKQRKGEGGGGEGETEKVASKKAEGSEDKKKRTKAFNYTSDVYNGADMDAYKWSQTVTELEVKVGLGEGTTAKHVKVDIQNEHLRVEILHPEHKVVLDGKLTNRVKVDESMWNVDRETCTLCINLEKSKELMWKSVLEGEKEIDITKIDNTRNVSEFDEEAQTAIQRASYDHHMKMQGLPTSQDKVNMPHLHCVYVLPLFSESP
jgi:hypothetical protein